MHDALLLLHIAQRSTRALWLDRVVITRLRTARVVRRWEHAPLHRYPRVRVRKTECRERRAAAASRRLVTDVEADADDDERELYAGRITCEKAAKGIWEQGYILRCPDDAMVGE